MFGRAILHTTWPRVEAVIDEIAEEDKHWWSKTTSKIVTLTFTHKSELFQKKRSYLIARNVKEGDRVTISINPKKRTDFNPYKPKMEYVFASVLMCLGLGLLYFCIFMIEWLA